MLLGTFGSLTGPSAIYGQSSYQGVKLAEEEINAQGGLLGKKVKILSEDDQGRPEEAKSVVIKLIRKNQVKAVIGAFTSSPSLAAAPECQKAKVPMLSPGATNPKLTQVGDYIFRTTFTDDFQGSAMAKFARNTLKLSKVAILKDIKTDYSIGLAEAFEKSFKEMGGQIVAVESYAEGDIEFRAQLTAIKGKSPQAIFLPGYYTEVGMIVRQARELGIGIPFLGGDGWDSPKTIEIGGRAVENSYFSNHYAEDDPDPMVRKFIEKFKKKYGTSPNAMSVLGYDAANLMFDAIKRAGSDDPEKIRNALAETQDFQGVSGKIKLNAKRDAEKRVVVMGIVNGKFQFKEAIHP